VDIKNVDGTFLDSEERLASAMLHSVDASRLTLLSYHCHGMSPAGVSCVGVLLESHVIALDLFTCGPNPLLPSLGDIERLFAVPQPHASTYQPPFPRLRHDSDDEEDDRDRHNDDDRIPREEDYIRPPRTVWSHVLRGFRPAGTGPRILD